jgi:hypothetical protein
MLFLLVILLCAGCKKEDPYARNEPRTEVKIPDPAFLAALIGLGVDTNGDREICPCEAEQIIHLDVGRRGISDMTGIEAFVSLKTLNCYENYLTSLDISKNKDLDSLFCDQNNLASLDVSNQIELKVLDCSENQLTTLDVSNNPELEYLYLVAMPTLVVVNVWVMPFPPDGVVVDTTGSPNIVFATTTPK